MNQTVEGRSERGMIREITIIVLGILIAFGLDARGSHSRRGARNVAPSRALPLSSRRLEPT